MKRLVFVLLFVAAMLSITSCGSYKRLAFLQDLKTDETYIVQERPEAKISVGDKLSIVVTCSNPTLAAPFNVVSGHSYYDRGSTSMDNENIGVRSEGDRGYLVDKNGDIDFPVLGKINVAGATLLELKNEIERLLKEKPYIQDPLVFVEFLNFQVTMLGQISNGNYIFKSGSVNILEALAEAGSLGSGAVIDELWVIRTTGGQRKLYTVNLKSKSLYDSPVFYLQQNDLIYAKPKNNLTDTEAANRFTAWSTFMTAISTLTTVWLIYLSRVH